jgi:hypothetical protein
LVGPEVFVTSHQGVALAEIRERAVMQRRLTYRIGAGLDQQKGTGASQRLLSPQSDSSTTNPRSHKRSRGPSQTRWNESLGQAGCGSDSRAQRAYWLPLSDEATTHTRSPQSGPVRRRSGSSGSGSQFRARLPSHVASPARHSSPWHARRAIGSSAAVASSTITHCFGL